MIRATLLAASALALATPAAAEDFVIVNATLAKGDGGDPIQQGVVIVDDNRVVYAGPQSGAGSFETATVYDVAGRWVTPGLVATLTQLGLSDVAGVSESNDTRAGGSRFGAALDVSPAINPSSEHITVHRAAGITRAATDTLPSAGIFGGQGAIIDLGVDGSPITTPRAFQLVALGETGARISGGSRVASFVDLANALHEADAYAKGKWDGADAVLPRADAEALGPVLNGSQKLYVGVERASDIRAVLGLKASYPKLDLVLLGASEGWIVASEIATSGVPVIADGLDDLPAAFEELAATQSNIGRMVKAGVRVAINAAAMENPRNLNQYAGNLVALAKVPGASGLSWGQALATITSVPAEISGLKGLAGVLAPGALADVVVWDNDPLELGSVPTMVFIEGVKQPLDSHQTRLRDRYKDLDETALPEAYDW
ncbi:amidohydrolase family protein [Erythrobacter mangrovi]|uniref:Amidohydrolase family protein n=1 Tax=Erythrobacter mangrovi TaxID=2739433 RepID=A0A7D3XHW3_9SPHN|nr:amidohydrolase family protein [Erythrobacter mangrovi]QKG70819.1 amidohydrolase family protein [Erythrobacter mangrovi]